MALDNNGVSGAAPAAAQTGAGATIAQGAPATQVQITALQAFWNSPTNPLPNTAAKGETVDYLWSLQEQLRADGGLSQAEAQLVDNLGQAALATADNPGEAAAIKNLTALTAQLAAQPGGLTQLQAGAIEQTAAGVNSGDIAPAEASAIQAKISQLSADGEFSAADAQIVQAQIDQAKGGATTLAPAAVGANAGAGADQGVGADVAAAAEGVGATVAAAANAPQAPAPATSADAAKSPPSPAPRPAPAPLQPVPPAAPDTTSPAAAGRAPPTMGPSVLTPPAPAAGTPVDGDESFTVDDQRHILETPRGGSTDQANFTGNLLANAHDPDGSPMQVSQVAVNGQPVPLEIPTAVDGGILTVHRDGNFLFVPSPTPPGSPPVGPVTVGYYVDNREGGRDRSQATFPAPPPPLPPAPPPPPRPPASVRELEIRRDIANAGGEQAGVTREEFDAVLAANKYPPLSDFEWEVLQARDEYLGVAETDNAGDDVSTQAAADLAGYRAGGEKADWLVAAGV